MEVDGTIEQLVEPPPAHSICSIVRTSVCPRCHAAEETTFHQLWECPSNAEVSGTHLELLPEARDAWQDCPAFWLRGLVPLQWVYPHSMRDPQGALNFSGCRPSQPIDVPPGAIIGTDGSGGPHSAQPRFRRCGWGFTVVSSDLSEVAYGAGPLLGWRQAVPLAELFAVKVTLL